MTTTNGTRQARRTPLEDCGSSGHHPLLAGGDGKRTETGQRAANVSIPARHGRPGTYSFGWNPRRVGEGTVQRPRHTYRAAWGRSPRPHVTDASSPARDGHLSVTTTVSAVGNLLPPTASARRTYGQIPRKTSLLGIAAGGTRPTRSAGGIRPRVATSNAQNPAHNLQRSRDRTQQP